MITLMKFLRSVYPISENLRDRLEDTVQPRVLRKNEYLFRAGQVCRNIYFVESGILRAYYNQSQKTSSYGFAFEGEICVVPSFFRQEYGSQNIQAIAETKVWWIDYDQYRHLVANFADFNGICRILLERCQRRSEERILAMWMQPAEYRYEWLLKQYPDILEKVPAKYLSSYLGITESMFSMVRNRSIPRLRKKAADKFEEKPCS